MTLPNRLTEAMRSFVALSPLDDLEPHDYATLEAAQAVMRDYLDREDRQRERTPQRKLQGRPLRSQSDKRRAEASKRAQVRIDVLARDGECIPAKRGMPGACEVYPDRAPLEVHEIAARGTHPGSHLDPDLCVATCPRHHDDLTSATGDLLALARKLDLRRRPTT